MSNHSESQSLRTVESCISYITLELVCFITAHTTSRSLGPQEFG